MQVAQTILAQLGGNRFLAMTGASNLVRNANALSFKLPRGLARDGINLVTVVLTPADLYNMTFYRLHGTNVTPLAVREGVYADQLRATFTAATGLDTSL